LLALGFGEAGAFGAGDAIEVAEAGALVDAGELGA